MISVSGTREQLFVKLVCFHLIHNLIQAVFFFNKHCCMSIYTHTKKLRQNDSWGQDINTNIWKWGFGKNIWAKYGLSGRRGNVRYWVVYCTGVSFVFRGSCSSICCYGGANCWVVQNVTRMEGNICVGLWVRAVVKHVLKGCEVENEVNGWTLEG